MSNDPLGALIQQSPVLASTAAVLLLMCCALLVAFGRLRRRLAAMQTQLDRLSRAIRKIEADQERSFVRSLNSPSSQSQRETPKSPSPSTDTLEEKTTSSMAPKQPDEKNSKGSALYLVTPKISTE